MKMVFLKYFLLGAFLFALLNSTTALSQNLVKNPGFEDSQDKSWSENNWAKNEVEVVRDDKNPHSGKYCQKVSMTKVTSTPELLFKQKVPVKPGMGLELRFWMKGPPNTKAIRVRFRKQGAPYTVYYESSATLSDTWREYVYTVMLPPKTDPNDTALYLGLHEENTYWLDDVSLTQVPEKDPGPPLVGSQIPNGSFEVGIDKWCATFREKSGGKDADELNINATLNSVLDAKAPHGKKVLSFPVKDGASVTLDSAFFPLRYGHPAKLALWVKTSAPGKQFTLKIMNGLFPNQSPIFEKKFKTKQADWEFFTADFTPTLSSSRSYFFELVTDDPADYSLDGVTAGEGELKYEPNPINVGFQSAEAKLGNIYFIDEPIQIKAVVESRLASKPVQLFARVVDAWEHEVASFPINVTTDKEGYGNADLTMSSKTYGGFKCEVFSDPTNKTEPIAEVMYSVLPHLKSPKESTDPFFGAHLRLTPHNLALASLMGVRSIRLHPPSVTKWKYIQKNGYELTGVKRATDMGFKLLGLFDTVPIEFADANPDDVKNKGTLWASFPPKDTAAWKDYVKKTYETFKPYIHEWEVWNEPDGGFLQLKAGADRIAVYTSIVKMTHEALEEAHADYKLYGGAAANVSRNFLEDCLAKGMNQDIDGISFHMYYEDASPDEAPKPTVVERTRKYQDIKGKNGAPLETWYTEGGVWLTQGVSWLKSMRIPSSSALNMLDAAHSITRTIAALKATGTARHFHYADFVHQAGHYVYRLECSGTFDVNGMANPAVAAHAACVRFLENATGKGLDELQKGKSKVVIAHLLQGQKNLEVVWSRIPIRISEVNEVTLKGRKAYDLMGNPCVVNGETLLTAAPIYLIEE